LQDPTRKSDPVSVTILPGVSVAVTPATPQNVGLGKTFKFSAEVTGLDAGQDASVSWSVNGVPGGDPTYGTIDPDGTYHAPTTLPNPPSVTITATSVAAPSAPPGSATAILSQGVVVQVTAPPSVVAQETLNVIATVGNATDKSVVWSVNGIPGGNASVGTIVPATISTAVYTAPKISLVDPVKISATSNQDSAALGTATVSVLPRPAVINPPNPVVSAGRSVQLLFQDAEKNTVIANAKWEVLEGDAWGTIDGDGLYAAPSEIPDPPQATIKATSSDDPRQTTTTRILIVPQIVVLVDPAEATAKPGDQVTFHATDGQKNPLTNVTWIIQSPASGGGSIDRSTGVYTAPSVVAAPFDVRIQAVAQTGDAGQAVVHLSSSQQAVGLLSGPEFRPDSNNARVGDIDWKTDVPSDSLVELGSAAGVYATQFSSSDAVTDHLVHVTGLLPGGTYHYRVRSKAQGRGDLVSGDQTFTALGEFRLDVNPRVPTASVSVDGTSYDGTQLPRTFAWPVGERHTIKAADLFQTSTSSRAVFDGWDDKTLPQTTPTATVSVPTSGQRSLTVNYSTQYLLNIDTNPADLRANGKGPKGSDYYNSGQSVSISAPTPVTFAERQYQFVRWNVTVGDERSQSSANPISVAMDGPVTLLAVYALTDQTGPTVSGLVASPNPTTGAKKIRLQATASDLGLGDAAIQSAEYSVDTPANAGQGVAMSPVDGKFDNVQEDVFASIDVSGWKVGEKHRLYVRSQDTNGNWGDASLPYEVVVSAETTAPSAVNDLKAQPHAGSTSSIDLTWTAPGDNGATGQADHYEIRYSSNPIAGDADFAAATLAANPPKPKPSGSVESFAVAGLQPDTRYYFALKAYDAAGNVSPLSNVASAITFGAPPTVSSTSPGNGDTGVDVEAPIIIAFSKPMNPNSVQISVVPDPAIQDKTWSADGKTLTLSHDPLQGDGTTYAVTVAAGADANGNKMAAPYVFSFVTFKAPGGLAETPWPMYRHDPLHSGKGGYSGPVAPVTSYTWAAPVPSEFSSPAVGIDRTIYVGSQGSGLVAVNPDGQVKWKALTSDEWVRSSPAIATDGTLYIGLPSGVLHAVEPDGQDRWSRDLQGAIVSSPAVGDDGTIYIGALNTLYALTPGNQVKWKFSTLGAIYSSPAVGEDGTVYFGSEDGALYAVGPNGTQRWFAQTLGGVRSSPLVTDDTVYVGSLDGYLYAINRNDGSVRWKFQADRDVVSSPALGADGNVYFASFSGTLYCLNSKGEKQWSVETGEVIEGSPSVDKDGVIYIGTSSGDGVVGQLYAFDPETGQQKWKLEGLSPISSSPIIGADGTLYIGSGSQLLLVGQQQTAPPQRAMGDMNGDKIVDIRDATLALRISIGLLNPTPDQLAAGDVAPKGVNGKPSGDGKIGVADVTRILRRAIGLEPDPWP
jgi:outer membrane protein assembly factor BamB